MSVWGGMSGEGAGGGERRGCRERVEAGHPRSVEPTRGTQGAQPVAVRVTTKRGQVFSPGSSSSQPRPGRDAHVHRLRWAARQNILVWRCRGPEEQRFRGAGGKAGRLERRLGCDALKTVGLPVFRGPP